MEEIMKQRIAGIDMGTQSIKVALYDPDAKSIVATAQEPLNLIAENDGAREQKTEWYDEALLKCFAALSREDRASIAAIGISGHQHGFVPLDKDGAALYNVKLWNDTSTVEECRMITEAAGGDDAVIAEICNLMLPGFTAGKVLWLKRHKPEAFAKLHYVMLPHNYLNFLLTGAYNAEPGDASGTAFYNGKTNAWSQKICACIDEKLFSLLPPLIASDEPNGFVSKKAADVYGIPAGIPVSSGGGDNMMGAIGSGCVGEGFLTMSLGTSGTLFGYSSTPIADPKNGISGFSASIGGYLPLLCTMNCTVASEETRSLFGVSVKEFDALAEKSAPGSNGIAFLPFFNGERTPNLPYGKASIMGITAANCSRENIARAALESAIFGMRGGFEAFNKLGFKAREIRIIGGGSKSALWRQMTADIMNLPVKRPVSDESGALGGALQAYWCLLKLQGKAATIESLCAEHIAIKSDDCVAPIAANVAAYNDAYGVYNSYLNALSPLYGPTRGV
jgi:xylulokinase